MLGQFYTFVVQPNSNQISQSSIKFYILIAQSKQNYNGNICLNHKNNKSSITWDVNLERTFTVLPFTLSKFKMY